MEFLTRSDIAVKLGVHIRTVDRLIKLKKLKIFRVGNLIRISNESFEDFVNKNPVK